MTAQALGHRHAIGVPYRLTAQTNGHFWLSDTPASAPRNSTARGCPPNFQNVGLSESA